MKDSKKIINRLSSHLSGLLQEYPENKNIIFQCFEEFLYDTIDSDIMVEVLEQRNEEEAKGIVLWIKVTEGW